MAVARKPKPVKAKLFLDTVVTVPSVAVMDEHCASTPRKKQVAAVEKAQRLTYDAWEAATEAGRIRKCQRALEISPLCADAYNALAGLASSPKRRLVLYELGMAAGERALGPEGFEEFAGEFWGWLETRPYMRARQGLAVMLTELGRREEAIGHYNALLDLNPNDNQGNRYLLLYMLLARDDKPAVHALLDKYDDEGSLAFSMTRALLAFQEGLGDAEAGREAARVAMEWNQHILPILTGKERWSPPSPYGTVMGGPDEASDYLINAGAGWYRTPGAIQWLETIAKQA
jgi:tetratricopeptide (TPR) repeat protein